MAIRIPSFLTKLFQGKIVKTALGVAVGGATVNVGAGSVVLDPSWIAGIESATALLTVVSTIVAAIAGVVNTIKK